MSDRSRGRSLRSPKFLPRLGRPARSPRARRPELEGLERRTVLSVAIAATNVSGRGYAGLDYNLSAGYTPDYPGNFGYNRDAFVFTLNMFGSTAAHAMVVSVSNADLANGVAQPSLHVYKNDINDANLRPTTMHDSAAGDPMWLVTEHG